jgi:hypothetical protein
MPIIVGPTSVRVLPRFSPCPLAEALFLPPGSGSTTHRPAALARAEHQRGVVLRRDEHAAVQLTGARRAVQECYEYAKGLARRHTRQTPARVIVKHRVSV